MQDEKCLEITGHDQVVYGKKRRADAMIYCKSWKDRSCEVGFAGEGDVVLDEIATLLAALHRDVLKRNAQKASEFQIGRAHV